MLSHMASLQIYLTGKIKAEIKIQVLKFESLTAKIMD